MPHIDHQDDLSVSTRFHMSHFLGLVSIVSLTALLALLQGFFNPVTGTDEGWYGAVSLEMVRRGDFFTPWYNSNIFLHKLPLLYWLQILSMELLGREPIALRLPSILAGVACIGVLYVFLVRRLGLFPALLGCAMLLSFQDFTRFIPKGQMEAPLILFMLCATLAFIAGFEKKKWFVWVGIMLAMAFWMKTYNITYAVGAIALIWLGSDQKKVCVDWRLWLGLGLGILTVAAYLGQQVYQHGTGILYMWLDQSLFLVMDMSLNEHLKGYSVLPMHLVTGHAVFLVMAIIAIVYAIVMWILLTIKLNQLREDPSIDKVLAKTMKVESATEEPVSGSINQQLAHDRAENLIRIQNDRYLEINTHRRLLLAGAGWMILGPMPYVLSKAINYWYLVPIAVGAALIWPVAFAGEGWRKIAAPIVFAVVITWSVIWIGTWYLPDPPEERELHAMQAMAQPFREQVEPGAHVFIARYPDHWNGPRAKGPDLPLVLYHFDSKTYENFDQQRFMQTLKKQRTVYVVGPWDLIENQYLLPYKDYDQRRVVEAEHLVVYEIAIPEITPEE